MKREFRAVWISDVHLCARDAQADTLHDFLTSIRCETLYLVGDIIDIWAFQRKAYWPRQYNEVLHQLLKFSRKGTKVIFIPGNHDEFFREFIGYRLGDVEVVEDAFHETADGKKLWVVHGDQFDTAVVLHPWIARLGDMAYQPLIALNRLVNRIRAWRGKPYWSLSGAIKRKVKHAVKFLNGFEKIVLDETRRRKADGIVCGHIHQPAMRKMEEILYLNTGDWIENCTALVESHVGELKLLWWRDEMVGASGRGTSGWGQETAPGAEGLTSEPEARANSPAEARQSPNEHIGV